MVALTDLEQTLMLIVILHTLRGSHLPVREAAVFANKAGLLVQQAAAVHELLVHWAAIGAGLLVQQVSVVLELPLHWAAAGAGLLV